MIRDDALHGLDPALSGLIRHLMEQQAQQTRELARLSQAVATIAEQRGVPVRGTHKCPRQGCSRWVTPEGGRWPAHEISAGPSGRRNGPMCPMSGQPVASVEVSTDSTDLARAVA